MSKPVFSFVLPVYNEEVHLGACLDSILSSQLPADQYEVIAVDNGSSDDSVRIIKEYGQVTLIEAPDCNVGEVRNIGAKAASGDYLVFIDSDCTITPDWLEGKRRLIRTHPGTVFGGGILLPENPTWIERLWTLQSADRSELPKRLIGASILTPRATFVATGSFNKELTSGEDSEFHERLLAHNVPVLITNEMDVTHLGNAKNIPTFIKRQIWHSENYLRDIKTSVRDPVFLLTAMSLTLMLLFLVSLATPSYFPVQMLLLAMLMATPLPLTAKRIHRARNYRPTASELPALYFIDCLYLIGRIIGLLSPLMLPGKGKAY